MRTNINKALLLPACLLALTACNENSWNDDYLDGFEVPEITQKENVEYTLTTADYKAIASNSTNKDMAGTTLANALAAVGTQCCFTDSAPAETFVPAFLNTTGWPYYALSNGSAVRLTYNVAAELPAEVVAINAAKAYTVSGDNYRNDVWESDDNFINAFAPVKPASKNIPTILTAEYPAAVQGDYVVVSYSESATNPVFGNVGGDTPQPENPYDFKPATKVEAGRTYMFYVASAGLCAAPLAEEKTYGYLGVANLAPNADGVIEQENAQNGFVLEAAEGGYYMKDVYGRYLYMSGTYNSFNLTATLPADKAGYVWSVSVAADGIATIKNVEKGKTMQYDSQYGSWGVYSDSRGTLPALYVMNGEPAAAAPVLRAPAAEPVTTAMTAVYYYNGSKWSEPNNITALNPDDYKTITGKTYGNLTADQAKNLLPIYLKTNFPYAQADDQQFIVYKAYQGTTPYTCTEFVFDGAEWAPKSNVEVVTNQFVRGNGAWRYDPSVTIVLPVGKSQELSSKYYQACTNWVYENIDVPLGSTSITSGKYYVTSYGNNEYYSGTSAYQGNVDLRASAARGQYPAAYENMTDEEIVALMKKRFETEVMPGALSMLHPEVAPMPGLDLYYTINFGAYQGTNPAPTYDIRFKVVGQGKFEFVDCTWNAETE